MRDLIGIDHLGVGADYDGVGDVPVGLEDVSKYPDLFAKLLEDDSWTEEDVKKVSGGNILRVLKEAEIAAEEMNNSLSDDTFLDYCDVIGDKECNCRFMVDVTDPRVSAKQKMALLDEDCFLPN